MSTPATFEPSGRRGAALAGLTAALVLAGVAAAGPSYADPPPEGPRLLIGLGDSYSTGGGIPPADLSSETCHRSQRAYPLVAADELGFAGENVACGGAVLADFTSTSRRGEPPQITGIGGADIVAFTMGGNDVGGPGGVLESGADAASMAEFAAQVEALSPQLVAAYTDVQRAAAGAVLYVMGYPDIVPRTQQALDSCLGARARGLVAADIHYNVALLNAAIEAAAAAVDAVFVDTSPSFAGHEMCTAEAYANAPGELAAESPGGGMHPNELGHLVLAADLLAAIGEPGSPPPAPGPPADPRPGVPPVVGPPSVPQPPGLTRQERAAAWAAAVALRHRIATWGGGPAWVRIPW